MIALRFDPAQISGLEYGLELVSRSRGFALSEEGISVSVQQQPEGLRVLGADGAYTVSYSKRHEFFRAVAMLSGKLEAGQTEFEILESSQLDLCGAMLDCSRNAVPRPEIVVDQLAKAAQMGMNCLMLYTEDTYEVEGYPYFGYMRGRYSMDEMRQFDKAALALGIDLIPCIQTLAHLKTTLRWDYAADIKDDADVLLIGEEKTYDLIEAMFKSLRACCSSQNIHIGMDEAEGVGLGNYLKKHGLRNRFDILSEHVDRVCQLARKYGFKPMMWSDMFFKIGSKQHMYYDVNVSFPEDLAGKIPEDISLVYWDYYHLDKDLYRGMIDGHRKLTEDVIFAGGIWKWSGMAPNHNMTMRTTSAALSACREKGIRRIFATMWGDDGGEVSTLTTLLGMQLFAEYSYYEDVSMGHLAERFKLCTGIDAEDLVALAIDDFDDTDAITMRLPPSKQILYMDVLQGLMDTHLENFDFESWYDSCIRTLQTLKPCPYMEKVYNYYRTLVPVLRCKCTLGRRVRKAYSADDRQALLTLAEECDALVTLYQAFYEAAYDLWMWENKPFGFDRIDLRMGGMIRRAQTAARRLRAYCAGDLEHIEELEEEILPFTPAKAQYLSTGKRFSQVSTVSAEW